MSTSARKENRWRRTVQEANDQVSDRHRVIEAAFMPRSARPPKIAPERKNSATRRQIRAWMRSNADAYDCATQLAEAANVEFDLPGEGLDDETHWVWEEAVLAGGEK